jgi:pimeloyl-ACP methyl ester carboxylesterase
MGNDEEKRACIVTRLKDGRSVSYALYGAGENPQLVVFYFHGFPGSRIEASISEKAAKDLGIMIIAVDRPGIGLSDYKPGRAIRDCVDDTLEIADQLKVEKFAVLGVSGGAPYANTCALEIGDRLLACAIVSGMGPVSDWSSTEDMFIPNRLLIAVGRTFPSVASLLIHIVGWWWRRFPPLALLWFRAVLSPGDRGVFRRREVQVAMGRSIQESMRSGTSGVAHEFRLLCTNWGERLEQVKARVSMWHGLEDTYVPVSMCRKVAGRIPGSESSYIEGSGHFMAVEKLPAVLARLNQLARS